MKKWLINNYVLALWMAGAALTSCSHAGDLSDAYGNFEAEDKLVSAESAGRLIWFAPDEGMHLEYGDTVGLVDTSSIAVRKNALYAKMQTISAGAENLVASRKVLEEQLQTLKTEEERVRKLFSEQAATQQQLDEITGKVKVAEKQIHELDVRRRSVLREKEVVRAEMESLNEKISKCFVVNPVAGTVLEKYADAGEWAAPGKPLYKIADISILFLRVYVDEPLLPVIKTGGRAEVLIDAPGGGMDTLSGTVTWIADQAEFTPKIIQTRRERVNLVYAVKIKVNNDGRLKIGMPGEANFR